MFNATRSLLLLGYASSIIILIGCNNTATLKNSSYTVTAELIEINGGIPQRLNYKYAFIMKYRVISGDIDPESEIYIGHLNPRKSEFTVGKTYEIAIEPNLYEIYDGGIVNRYQQDISPYLAVDMR